MLVLSRKKGQSIMIGDGIEIFIADINADTVRLGIKANKSVPIYRREIYDMIIEENMAAAQSPDIDGLADLPILKK